MSELEQLQRIIVIGGQVREMLNSQAWREYVGPLLDNMIIDVLGGKENGRWHNGALDDKELKESVLREKQSYKAALVNFHSGIMDFVDSADDAAKQLEELMKENV